MKTTITTATTRNLSSSFSAPIPIPTPNPNGILFRQRCIVPAVPPLSSRAVSRRSSNGNGGSNNGNGGSSSSSLRDLLSGMVDERVEDLLNKEENKGLLDGLEQASKRVEMAKTELAQIETQQIQATAMREYVARLESRASQIAECQKEISEARARVEEAEQSLSEGQGGRDLQEERLESVKAALISAVVGTLAELPASLSRATSSYELVLPLGITFVSCALFGVTFRYAVRRDLDNFQLKSGTCAAFAFVKGLGKLGGGSPLELDVNSFISHAYDGALYVSESLLVFLFAGVALDFCIKLRILSPFPIDPSVPKT